MGFYFGRGEEMCNSLQELSYGSRIRNFKNLIYLAEKVILGAGTLIES